MVVEDETILGDSICTYLEHHGYSTVVARSGEDGLRLAEEGNPDVALVDIRLPGLDGLSALRKLRDVSAGTEVIMMTAHASVASAVDAMKAGAFDYLTKPLDLDEVRVVVDKALAHQRMRRELNYLKAREETGGHTAAIVGESQPIRVLRQQIDRIAALEFVFVPHLAQHGNQVDGINIIDVLGPRMAVQLPGLSERLMIPRKAQQVPHP